MDEQCGDEFMGLSWAFYLIEPDFEFEVYEYEE